MNKALIFALCLSVLLPVLACCGGVSKEGASSVCESAESAATSAEESSADSGGESRAHVPGAPAPAISGGEPSYSTEMEEVSNGRISFLAPAYSVGFNSEGEPCEIETEAFNIAFFTEQPPAGERYGNMTEQSFEEDMKPTLESRGYSVHSAEIWHTVNSCGTAVTVIRFSARFADAEIVQTYMAVPTGEDCQVVILTENVDCGDLYECIVDSIVVL